MGNTPTANCQLPTAISHLAGWVDTCPEERAMADRSSLEAAKVEAAIGNRILAECGLAVGARASPGHVSMRGPRDPNLVVVKGRGYRMDGLSRKRPEGMGGGDPGG